MLDNYCALINANLLTYTQTYKYVCSVSYIKLRELQGSLFEEETNSSVRVDGLAAL